MKQTTVEWLLEQLELHYNGENDMYYSDFVEKAKEMEKQQIIDAYRVGKVEATFTPEKLTIGEQYYNETFKK